MKGMMCPICGGESEVKDSRPSPTLAGAIRRRRHCLNDPEHRFTTYEVLSDNINEIRSHRKSTVEMRQAASVILAIADHLDGKEEPK